MTAKDIVARAAAGHEAEQAAVRRLERRLAKALAAVINVLDPDVIVLGGGLSHCASLYEQVPRLWQEYVFGGACHTELRQARHGDASGVRGAAWLWPMAGAPRPEGI